MNASERSSWLDAAVVVAACAIAWLTFFQPIFLSPNDVPGDLGDARLNIYLLEHVHRWLAGWETSLLSPGFYWPYPYALGGSDTHAGTAIVYAGARTVGLDPYDAFKVWFALGYAATFLAAYHVIRKLAFGPLLAGALAFAFAFSLPAVSQMGHAQLTWRVAVPYCFWFTLRYAEKGAPADLFRFLTAFAIQMLISVYLGIFALILCALLFAGNVVARDGLSPRGWRRRAAIMLSAFGRIDRAGWRAAAVAAVALLALAALLGFQAYVSALYDIERPWSEISTMIPRLQSYLFSNALPYWTAVVEMLPPVPMANEQGAFLGVPVTLLALAGLVYACVNWRSASPRLRAVTVCILAALVLFTTVHGVTLYWFVAQLPGFNAVRAVSRVVVVLAFPVVLLIGLFVREVAARRGAPWLVPATAIVIAGFVAFDLAVMNKSGFSSDLSRQRVAALVAADPDGTGPVAYGMPTEEVWYAHAIDAMLAAQQSGRATLHGYSGFLPEGGILWPSCTTAEIMLLTYERWARRHDAPTLAALGETPVAFRMGDCDLSPEAIGKLKQSFGRGLSRSEAPLVALDELAVADDGGVLTASVRVTNGTGKTMHARSRHPFRLAWRTGQTDWITAVPLGASLRPGESRRLSWVLPDGTRREDLSVTFVVENGFWAHDAGFAPLRGDAAQ